MGCQAALKAVALQGGSPLCSHTHVRVVISNQIKGTTPLPTSYPPCVLPLPLPAQGDTKGWPSPWDPEPADGGSVAGTLPSVSQPTPCGGRAEQPSSHQQRQKMMLKLILCGLGAIWLWKQAAPLEGASAGNGSKMGRCGAQPPPPQTHEAGEQHGAARHGSTRQPHTACLHIAPIGFYTLLRLPKSLSSQARKP